MSKKNLSEINTNKTAVTHKSMGQKTREELKRKGVKSPDIGELVHVKGRTHMVPKVDVSTPEKLEEWRQSVIEKYKL